MPVAVNTPLFQCIKYLRWWYWISQEGECFMWSEHITEWTSTLWETMLWIETVYCHKHTRIPQPFPIHFYTLITGQCTEIILLLTWKAKHVPGANALCSVVGTSLTQNKGLMYYISSSPSVSFTWPLLIFLQQINSEFPSVLSCLYSKRCNSSKKGKN